MKIVFTNEAHSFLHQFFSSASASYSAVYILADEVTSRLCYPVLLNMVPELSDSHLITIKTGEEHKTLKTCEEIWEFLIRSECDRHGLMVCLGGGVICDIGGFAAHVFKRGIDCMYIPTTLLAMVDAAIGGKTGVNFHSYKNYLGTFRSPVATVIVADFLKTLPANQLMSGFAEMIKHALIHSKERWETVSRLFPLLQQSVNEYIDTWIHCINESVQIKEAIVTNDFHDKAGRQVLNFGHTIAHALESYLLSRNDTPLLHGFAVANGIVTELMLSCRILGLPRTVAEEAAHLILQHYGGYNIPDSEAGFLLEFMRRDKKNKRKNIRFTLLHEIGRPQTGCECHEEDVLRSIRDYNELTRKYNRTVLGSTPKVIY